MNTVDGYIIVDPRFKSWIAIYIPMAPAVYLIMSFASILMVEYVMSRYLHPS